MELNHNLEKQIKNYRYNFQDYLGQGSYSKVFLGKVYNLNLGLSYRVISCY